MFSAAERAQIRQAAEDHAGRYFGGPLGLGRDDAARYVAEGHLGDVCGRHGLAAVWKAVADFIDQHPQVLDRRLSDVEISQRQADRSARAAELSRQAAAAFRAGDADRALALIDEGEQTCPGYRAGLRSWDDLRARVRACSAAPA